MNHNPQNLQVGQSVLFEGKETKIEEFIDPITCVVMTDKKHYYVGLKSGFWNKLFGIKEVVESTYKSETQCSIWSLKPIN